MAMLVIGAAAASPAQTSASWSSAGCRRARRRRARRHARREQRRRLQQEARADDCASIVDALKDLGYLEAQAKAATAFVPGGIRLVFTVTPRSLVTIDSVLVPDLAKPEVQQLLDGLAITRETPARHAVRQRLGAAVAQRLGINALFLGLDFRISAAKHDAVLVFSK